MKKSNLLIGQKGDNKNRYSSLLLGNLKDNDKDGYVSGFSKWVDDCNDKNKRKHGETILNEAERIPKQVIPTVEEVKTKIKTEAINYVDSRVEVFNSRIKEIQKQLGTERDSRARSNMVDNIRELERMSDAYSDSKKYAETGNYTYDEIESHVQADLSNRAREIRQETITKELTTGLKNIQTIEDYEKYYNSLSSSKKEYLESPSSIRERETKRLKAIEKYQEQELKKVKITPKETEILEQAKVKDKLAEVMKPPETKLTPVIPKQKKVELTPSSVVFNPEKALGKSIKVKEKEILPKKEPKIITAAPTGISGLIEKAKMIESSVVFKTKEIYGQLFEQGEPTYKELTPRKVAGDISQAFLYETPILVSKTAGYIAEKGARKLGAKEEGYDIGLITPSVTIPQKVTITTMPTATMPTNGIEQIKTTESELRTQEYKSNILSPSQIGKAVETTVLFAPAIAPSKLLLAGGLAILTAPKETYRPPEVRVYGGIIAGIGAYGVTKELSKPILIQKKPKIPEPTFEQIQKTLKKGERELTFTSMKVIQEIPEVKGFITTRKRQILQSMMPEEKIPKVWEGIITPKKTIVSYTPEPFIDKGFIITKKTGARQGIVSTITSKTEPISLEDFSKLSKQQKALFSGIAESKTGIPSKEFTPQILKDYQAGIGYSESRKVSKIKPKKGEIDFFPEGKLTRSELAVVTKEIPTEGLGYKLYEARAAAVDITFPSQIERIKKPKTIKGKIKVYEPIDITPETLRVKTIEKKGIKEIKEIGISKKPSVNDLIGSTKLRQELIEETPTLKHIFIPETPKITTKKLVTKEAFKFTFVGFGALPVSEYYGKTFIVPRTYEPEYISKGITPLGLKDIQTGLKDIQLTSLKDTQLTRSGLIGAAKEKEESIFKTGLISFTDVITIPREKIIEEQKITPREILKERQVMEAPIITPFSIPISPVIPTTRKVPEEPIRIIPPVWLPERKKKYKEVADGYSAQAYIDSTKERKAHWETLNKKPLTRKSALSLAARKVDKTISAKGRIVKLKKKVKPIDTRDNYFERNRYKFRQFKQKKGVKQKTPNQFIELQKYRADSPMEVSALKKGKRDSIKNLFGF